MSTHRQRSLAVVLLLLGIVSTWCWILRSPQAGAQEGAGDPKPRTEAPDYIIVVSGFEKFGSRTENTSDVIAKKVVEKNKSLPVNGETVRVVWAAPGTTIQSYVAKKTPIKVWLAMGENLPDSQFYLETVAKNYRNPAYKDNNGDPPPSTQIDPNGAASYNVQVFAVNNLQPNLKGISLQSSTDAGGFLCNEVFYSLELEQAKANSPLKASLFIHVPVLNSGVQADDRLADDFSSQILGAVLKALESGK